MSSVDVCIVSFGSGELLSRAVRSARNHIPDVGILAVEHHPDERVVEKTRRELDGLDVELALDSTNPGFGAGCNRLAAASTADWLLFLNPDAVVLAWPGTERFRAGTIVGPWMGSEAATRHHSGRRWTVVEHVRRAWLRWPGPPPAGGEGFVSGAALLIHRDDFERVGGFDEDYFMYYEDIDLCRRAAAVGIGTRVCTDWIVEHDGAHASQRDFASSIMRSHRSAVRYHRAHGGSVTGYLVVATVDSLLRAAWFAARRDRLRANAYLDLGLVAGGAVLPWSCRGRAARGR